MKMAMIEDDTTISFAVKTFLKRYDIEVSIFHTLNEADKMNTKEFDLMILDVNLPDGSGFDFLKWIREFSEIPVIMLTVKSSDEYVLQGFSQGADEYIVKPFSLPVLKARIDNLFRRKELNAERIVYDELILDLSSKTAKINDCNLELSRQEFAVLEMLLENKDINVIRERIIDSVWGYELYEVNDNTLTVTVKRLRNKLGKYGAHIKTIRGIGYMWESESYEKL